MKKIFLITLLLSVLLLSFAACFDGDDINNGDPDTGNKPPVQDTVKKEGIEFELKDGATVDVGKTAALKVINLATGKQTANLFWESDNMEVATVDSNGNVTGVSQGSAVIKATTFDRKFSAECVVTVVLRLSGVQLDHEDYDLEVGDTVQLTASPVPDSFIGSSYTWLSSVPDVASVDENGLVTAHKLGNASIMVSAEPGGHTAICSIKVGKYADSITLEETELTINRGVDHQLVLNMLPADATTRPHWRSSDESVVIVNSGGVVTAKKVGKATVTVSTTNGLSVSCKITVVSALTGFEFTQSEITVNKRSKTDPQIIFYPEDATNKNIEWTSSDPTIAIVEKGRIVALKNGTVTLTAESEDGGYIQTLTVNVVNPLLSIEFEGEKDVQTGKYPTITVPCTDSVTLAPIFTPLDADEIPFVVWESSNVNVATVTNGVLNTYSIGSATITVTAPNGLTASFDVEVIKKVYPVESFHALSDTYYMNVGDLLGVKFKYIPEESEEDAVISEVIFSQEGIALWNAEQSLVIATALGECEITFKIVNADLSEKTCTVKIKIVEESTSLDDEYKNDTHALRDKFNAKKEDLNKKHSTLKAREIELLELIEALRNLINSGASEVNETPENNENPPASGDQGNDQETPPTEPQPDPNEILLKQYEEELVNVRVEIRDIEKEIEQCQSDMELATLALESKYSCVIESITYDPDIDPYPDKADDEFVKATDYSENTISDLDFAKNTNETGKKIYDFTDAYLRYGTVKKLVKVADFFASINDGGYKLVITEAFRPTAAEEIIWNLLGASGQSYGPFCKGNAVRIALVNLDGTPAEDTDGGLMELLIMQMELKGFVWNETNSCFIDSTDYALESQFLSDMVSIPEDNANITFAYGDGAVPGENYVSYEDTTTLENNSILVFTTDKDITDFKLHSVDEVSGDIDEDPIYTLEELESGRSLVITTYINDVAENRAISYVDTDGETRCFLVNYSAIDGSLTLDEIE